MVVVVRLIIQLLSTLGVVIPVTAITYSLFKTGSLDDVSRGVGKVADGTGKLAKAAGDSVEKGIDWLPVGILGLAAVLLLSRR